jgi:hypothetical protein
MGTTIHDPAPTETVSGTAPGDHRRTATVVGVLLIVCTGVSILSIAPLGSMLERPVDLARLAANDDRVVLSALIEFVAAATGAGTAIALHPVLRGHCRSLAFGAAAARPVQVIQALAQLAFWVLPRASRTSDRNDRYC